MVSRVVPTLSSAGWVKDSPTAKVDRILSYFFETLPSENIFNDAGYTSAQEILSYYANDPDKFCEHIAEALRSKFNMYFSAAQVTAEIINYEKFQIDGKAVISIKITIVDNNRETINIQRQMQEIDGVFRLVVQQINYGVR